MGRCLGPLFFAFNPLPASGRLVFLLWGLPPLRGGRAVRGFSRLRRQASPPLPSLGRPQPPQFNYDNKLL